MLITGKGHPNITARHPTTIAFTRDKEVTLKGDCFVAVECGWEVDSDFLEKLRTARKITATIECSGYTEVINGRGHPGLTLSDKDLVIRKSDWVDERTLMLGADKSAQDLGKEMVRCLKKPVPVTVTITIPE